jgi:predicted ABC-type transport system involved in lysophospholipase L1 biosynthesis ATPase subunit
MSPDTPDLLDVRELAVDYRRGTVRKSALHAVSLRMQAAEAVAIIGETGSGKTTLARAILGLVKPDHGSVQIAGEDVGRFSAKQWTRFRRKGLVQYVFQDPLQSLDPDLTAGESIAEPLRVQGKHSAAERVAAVSRYSQLMALEPTATAGGDRSGVDHRATAADPRRAGQRPRRCDTSSRLAVANPAPGGRHGALAHLTRFGLRGQYDRSHDRAVSRYDRRRRHDALGYHAATPRIHTAVGRLGAHTRGRLDLARAAQRAPC